VAPSGFEERVRTSRETTIFARCCILSACWISQGCHRSMSCITFNQFI